jgi:F-type H+-transporting ATPase subunit alpha
MHANHQDVYDGITKTGKLPTDDSLGNAIKDFKDNAFQTTAQLEAAKKGEDVDKKDEQ